MLLYKCECLLYGSGREITYSYLTAPSTPSRRAGRLGMPDVACAVVIRVPNTSPALCLPRHTSTSPCSQSSRVSQSGRPAHIKGHVRRVLDMHPADAVSALCHVGLFSNADQDDAWTLGCVNLGIQPLQRRSQWTDRHTSCQ